MKANEAPENIYIQPNAHDGWLEINPNSDMFVEYVRKDVVIEKACDFIKANIDHYIGHYINDDDTYLDDSFIEDFTKYMEDSKVWKKLRKFHEGDKLISTRNPSLTYEVLEVGHINELGNPEYKVRIFDNGKEAEPSRAYYIECKKVDEWAKLIEPSPSDKPFDYENANIKQKDFAPS